MDDRATARSIMEMIEEHTSLDPVYAVSIEAAITQALAAKVPDGHIMLPGGRVVKVLGDIDMLPKTDDGAIEFPGAEAWHLFNNGQIVQGDRYGRVMHPTCGEFGGHHHPRFSTREAAEAAAEGRK